MEIIKIKEQSINAEESKLYKKMFAQDLQIHGEE